MLQTKNPLSRHACVSLTVGQLLIDTISVTCGRLTPLSHARCELKLPWTTEPRVLWRGMVDLQGWIRTGPLDMQVRRLPLPISAPFTVNLIVEEDVVYSYHHEGHLVPPAISVVAKR